MKAVKKGKTVDQCRHLSQWRWCTRLHIWPHLGHDKTWVQNRLKQMPFLLSYSCWSWLWTFHLLLLCSFSCPSFLWTLWLVFLFLSHDSLCINRDTVSSTACNDYKMMIVAKTAGLSSTTNFQIRLQTHSVLFITFREYLGNRVWLKTLCKFATTPSVDTGNHQSWHVYP